MGRVAVGVEADHLEASGLECVEEGFSRVSAALHLRQVKMRRCRPPARVHLDPVDAEAGCLIKHLLETKPAKAVRYESDLHGCLLTGLAALLAPAKP